ncbi:MAG: hypothetical protein Q6354_02715, partial [Candidatus Brocadiales bacterium]|nr:hypothetical protein [Candidatus Brocadiales bacterium]
MENTSDTIVVNRNERTLRNGLVLPNKNLNIFIGPNNSGKSNILMYINTHFADSYYISPQRLHVSDTIPIIQDIMQSFNQSRDQRKTKQAGNSEIPGPDPTQELATLDK